MAKDIFLADYSSCRQTSREITSNGSYLDDILDFIEKGDGYITTAGGQFDKTTYNELIAEVKKYIEEDKNRYSSFYTKFEEFHTPLEDIDAGLSQMLDSQLDNIKKNNNYDSYVAVINSNEQSNYETSLYYSLLEQGLSNEDALKFAAMGDQETEDLIKKFADMSPSEYEEAIKALKEKADKSPAELFLCDICSFDKTDSNIGLLKDITTEFGAGGGWVSVLERGLLDRSLSQANLDVNSITGQMTKLKHQIRTSQLSQLKIDQMTAEYDRLAIIRNERLNKVAGVTNTEKTVAGVTKAVGVAITIYQVAKIGKDEWDAFYKDGVELDDCIVDAGLSLGGLYVSTVAGATAGEYIGGAAGTAFSPGVGTGAGIVGGLVVGGVVGLVYDGIVKPVGVAIYENALEPAGEWIGDRVNDVGDWWDSLWW